MNASKVPSPAPYSVHTDLHIGRRLVTYVALCVSVIAALGAAASARATSPSCTSPTRLASLTRLG